MKKRLVAFIMALAMVLTMVPIVALAEDLPNVTPASTDVYLIENYYGYEDVYGEEPNTYFHYWLSANFDVDGQDWPVGISQPFEYNGNCYSLEWNDPQSCDNQWEVGHTYPVQIDLHNSNDGSIVKESIFELNVSIVEKPDVKVSFNSSVDLYKGIDSFTSQDWITDPKTGEDVLSPDYERYNYDSNFVVEYDGETYNDMFIYYGQNYYPEYRFPNDDDQTYDKQWLDGESHIADIYFLNDYVGQVTFNACGSLVKSFEIIDDITLVKGISDNGTGYYDFNNRTFFANIEFFDGTKYENARIDCGMFQDGIEYNGNYISVSFSDDQNENPWVDVGDYKEKISVLGYETEITVHLVDTIIDSADFNDVSIYEFTNGYYSDFGEYIYDPDVEMSNVFVNGEKYSDFNTIGINYNGDWREVSLLYDQFENPLHAGDKVKSPVSIFGYNGEINLEVLKADIINEMNVMPKKVSITECTNGFYDGETYIYNVAPQFIVSYKDGSIGFDTKIESDSYEFLYFQRYYEKAIDDYFTYSWHDAAGYDQYENNWVAGNTYKMVFDFIGQQFEYEVEIVPSEVQSIEIIETPKAVPDKWGGYYLIQDTVLVEVTYKDGRTEQKNCEELGVDYFYLDCTTNTLTVTYQGKTDSAEIEVASASSYPVEKLVIDESTLSSAYLIDGEYYFNPSDFYVDVYYKDGTTSREYIEKTGEPVWIEKDGYKMNLSAMWVDYSTWTDDSHTFSVGVDNGFVQSDEVEVNVVDDVTCEKVELVTPQTFTYYKNDALFSDCMTGEFCPFDLRGMKVKVTMSNGDIYYLYGDNLYTNAYGSDFFSSLGSSEGVEFRILDKSDGYTSHISINVFGKTFPLFDIEAIDSNITDIEVLNYDDLKENIAQNDATGLKFKVFYANGTTKEITLGKEEQDWIGVSWNEKGDGGVTPVDKRGVSGIRYSWYKVNGEYASIIWNNKLLRFEDTILFLDTGKTINLNSNLAEGTVEVSSDTIMNDVIDQLSLENRYKVEQQGMDINTEISVNSTDASKDILKLAKKDDATIEVAYAIDLAYILDGETLELTELGDGKVAVKIKLPDELVGKDNIVVYREHTNPDGSVTVEEIQGVLSEDGKYVTFESSKFSTFALGYKDKKDVPPGGNGGTNNEKPTLPEAVEKIANTLDNTPIAATMMLVCSSGLCLFAVARKRKELK